MARTQDPVAKRMGLAIRAVREEQALTQQEVADKYGVTDGAIAAYEQGRSRFAVQDLPGLADALGVPTTYLSRRLGLCGDNSDLNALLLEFAGPEIGQLVAQAVTMFPNLDGDRRAFFVHALRSL